jgi:hypothetical protein
MKRIIWLSLLFISLALSAFAAPFSPAILKLTAPAVIPYSFEGKDLSVPVTVAGTPAEVTFLVFTRGKAASIKKYQERLPRLALCQRYRHLYLCINA